MRTELAAAPRRRTPRSVALLLAGLAGLTVWQLMLFRAPLPSDYMLKASSGLHSQEKFVYFLYYLNLFPVATLDSGIDPDFYFDGAAHPKDPDRRVFSREAAERTIAERGSTLVMEWGHTTRFGSDLQTYLYLIDAWRRGTPENAEMRIATSLVFFLGLAGLLISFWYVGLPVLGFVLVGLLGSNPFQLFEAYRREQIFGWPIAVFCVTLALMLPVITGTCRRWYAGFAVVICALVLATAAQIRFEAAVSILGVAAVCLGAPRFGWPLRVGLIAVLWLAFTGTSWAWSSYFDHKWTEATAVVRRAGGHVYDASRAARHQFWGSLWSGLGDFDTTHGYSWRDDLAVAYAEPVLEQQYGEKLPWWWGTRKPARTPDDYFDPDHLYYRHPLQTPHLLDVMRDKVLHDIAADPFWYVSILARRVWRVLRETTPVMVQLTPGIGGVIPFSGLLVVPFALVAWLRRDWIALRILVFSLPLSLTAVAIYSGGNIPYYGVYHLCAAAVIITWGLTYVTPALAQQR